MKPKLSPTRTTTTLRLSMSPIPLPQPSAGTPMNSPTMDHHPTSFSLPLPTLPSPSVILEHKLLHRVMIQHGGQVVKDVMKCRKAKLSPTTKPKTPVKSPPLQINASRAVTLLRQLHDAAAEGKLSEVVRLLDSGVDADGRDEKGRSGLHFACAGGWVDVVECLAERRVDMEVKDVNGNTPLHLAVVGNWVDCVLVLLRCGANASATDHFHRTPLQLVQSRLRLITDRALTENTQTLVIELRKLIEILTLLTPSIPSTSTPHPTHTTYLDPDALAERLERISTGEEVGDVVEELRGLVERLAVGEG